MARRRSGAPPTCDVTAYRFEKMSGRHRQGVVDIFNYFVTHTFAAYPQEPVGYDVFDRFSEMAHGYPSVVVHHSTEGVVGFAFLHPYHSAKTLRRAAEITTFILPRHTRKGLGTAILERFVDEAQDLGVDTIVANISSRNEASIRFHRNNGFRECGRLCRVGRKFERDFDVIWMQLQLSELGSEGTG